MSLEVLNDLANAIEEKIIMPEVKTVEDRSYMWDFFQYSYKDMMQETIKIVYQTEYDHSGGPVGERGTIMDADRRAFARGQATTRKLYYSMDLSGWELYEAKEPKNMINVVKNCVVSRRKTMIQDFNRQFHGDGSGRIAEIASISGSAPTTITINPATGSILHFAKNMYIEVRDNANEATVHVSNVRIASVDVLNNAFTIAEADPGFAATDYIYKYGYYDAAYKEVMMGIKGIINTADPAYGSFQGIDRDAAGNEYNKGYVDNNSGTPRPLTSILMMETVDNIDMLSGGEGLDTIITEPKIRQSYALLLEAANQPITNIPSTSGTKEKLSYQYAGKTYVLNIVADSLAGAIYYFPKKVFEIRASRKLGLDKNLNHGKWVGGHNQDIIFQRFVIYANLICTDPKATGVLKDLTQGAIS